jgi:hypothetical protein
MLLQLYVEPPLAVKTALSPVQSTPSSEVVPEVSVTVIEGVGSGFTVIVVLLEVEQPLPSVTVTL